MNSKIGGFVNEEVLINSYKKLYNTTQIEAEEAAAAAREAQGISDESAWREDETP